MNDEWATFIGYANGVLKIKTDDGRVILVGLNDDGTGEKLAREILSVTHNELEALAWCATGEILGKTKPGVLISLLKKLYPNAPD